MSNDIFWSILIGIVFILVVLVYCVYHPWSKSTACRDYL